MWEQEEYENQITIASSFESVAGVRCAGVLKKGFTICGCRTPGARQANPARIDVDANYLVFGKRSAGLTGYWKLGVRGEFPSDDR
jgi:hypothetical protein